MTGLVPPFNAKIVVSVSAKTCPAETLGVVADAMARTMLALVVPMLTADAEPNRYKLHGPACVVVLYGIGLAAVPKLARTPPAPIAAVRVVAGGLVTFVLFQQVPDALWMLPGLWSMFFSLGIFASYRLLPRATFWVGVFYMTAGVLCLLWARNDFAFSPWAMGLPFGVGQFVSAAILYWTLERTVDDAASVVGQSEI